MEILESQDFTEIPEDFYATDTDLPFNKCISCHKNLLIQGTLYYIEKAYKRYPKFNTKDVIFEYAMCSDCYQEVIQEFSSESKEKIITYFEQNVDFDRRRKSLLGKGKIDASDWLSHCIVKGTSITELTEYQIVGQFDGLHLMYYNHPFTIGFQAVEELAGLLSNKTLDELDGFRDKFFRPPPEFEDLLKPPRLVVV